MEGVLYDDPFLWGVETVVETLCSLSRPCAEDPADLASKIREEGIDGLALLTFEFVCSRPELFECLGIKRGVHKASLGRTIISLRSKSAAFRQWKLELLQEQSEELTTAQAPQTVAPAASKTPPPVTKAVQDSGAEPQGVLEELKSDAANCQTADPRSGDKAISPQKRPSLEDVQAPIAPSLQSPDQINHESTQDPKSLKRKRVAPLQLTTRPVNLTPVALPTEADGFIIGTVQDDQNQDGPFPWEKSAPHAYLGKGVVKISAIKDYRHALSSQVIEDDDTLAVKHPVTLPAGLRRTANRVMMRFLKQQSEKENMLRQGFEPRESSIFSDDSDEVVDVFNLPDEVDEDTRKEMELEEAEMKEAEALRQASIVKQERVSELLDEVIEAFKTRWDEVKLPKHQLKAYWLYTDARKRGVRKQRMLEALQRAQTLDNRIHKLRDEIIEQTWTKESEVRDQAKCMQQTVEDKVYNLWLAKMLDSRLEPPKPESLPRPRTVATKRSRSPARSEILTSSDEDDFIVPDEDEAMKEVASIGNDSIPALLPDVFTPVKAEAPWCVDLTQVETPDSLRRSRHRSVIDLTTPIKPRSALNSQQTDMESTQEPIIDELSADEENFETFEEIGQQKSSHWASLRDRKRLIICLLWGLSHSQRTAIFQSVKENSPAYLFSGMIEAYLINPLQNLEESENDGGKAITFHFTRLLLSYIRVKAIKRSRYLRLPPKDQDKLRESKTTLWGKFLAFLGRIASGFPQDSQIFRTDAFDEEIGDLNDVDDGVPAGSQGTPSRRKAVAKEIIRNKAAVDLREAELRRREEQEARRNKVRATRHTMSTVDRDKSRLIINEAKEDHESFIYINDEIGKLIQDHQVTGVRFLWDQIMRPRDVRQGCLLAHTMGLGKSMQVVTFLVAIQEAAQSVEPAIRNQVPEDLRASKTLVLCPASVVDNWVDEMLNWAPFDLLGQIRKIDSAQHKAERKSNISAWVEDGGVLIIGYNMLKQGVDLDDIGELLITSPNIVVADEAHTLKSPETKVHQVCSRFKTNCRIALTGTPLANNVEEYYYMVNWVAPNFLGPIDEFKNIYASPIQRGLWGDSLPWDKRRALKMLQVLKETVAPKVDRKTINSLPKHIFPNKFEFVIFVQPTPLQRRLYDIFISGLDPLNTPKRSDVLALVDDLTLLCNHPRCFRERINAACRMSTSTEKEKKNTLERLSSGVINSTIEETTGLDLDSPSHSRKTEMLCLILDEARSMGDKVLVFTQSRPTLDYLDNLLKMQKRNYVRLDGKTRTDRRQELTKDFNKKHYEVFIISTKAGGVGLNIQGANRVVIFDFRWNPFHEQQAIGRAYRIGQKKPVFVYQFVVAGSFEEDMQNKAVFKLQLASRVVDEKNPVSWSKRISSFLHAMKSTRKKSIDEFAGRDRILDKLIGRDGNREVIQSIMSTDTFEEEDPTVDLTAEERRDAEALVRINRLRLVDPEEYERQASKQREEEQRREFNFPARNYSMASVDNFQPMAKQEVTVAQQSISHRGTYNFPPRVSQQTNLTAPLPMPGANTFFGSASMPRTVSTPNADCLPSVPTTPKPKLPIAGAKIFDTPRRSQARDRFEQRLSDRLETLQSVFLPVSGPGKPLAKSISSKIHSVQTVNARGFLVDDQQWRLLDEKLVHDRFLLAMASGHLTPSYLANVDKAELEKRIAVLASLAEKDFETRIAISGGNFDPDNLHNLTRLAHWDGGWSNQSPHGSEDMWVMRDAAYRRLRRSENGTPGSSDFKSID